MNAELSPLLRIRAERDQMSAIERRIADYLVENAHFLRDYSSQQLANALGISQSSVTPACFSSAQTQSGPVPAQACNS